MEHAIVVRGSHSHVRLARTSSSSEQYWQHKKMLYRLQFTSITHWTWS